MLIVNVTQARMLVSAFGGWPIESVMVMPDPIAMHYIIPAFWEFVRN